MKECSLCKHGQVNPGQTTLTIERNGSTMVIKEVPALVCDNCGEAYLDESIVKRLEKLAEAAGQEGVQVEVRRYKAA